MSAESSKINALWNDPGSYTRAEFNLVPHPWNKNMEEVRVISQTFSDLPYITSTKEDKEVCYRYYLDQMNVYHDKLIEWLEGNMDSIDSSRNEASPWLHRLERYPKLKERFHSSELVLKAKNAPNFETYLECQFPIIDKLVNKLVENSDEGRIRTPIPSAIELTSKGWRSDLIKDDIRRHSEFYIEIFNKLIYHYQMEWETRETINVDVVIELGLLLADLKCGNFDVRYSYYFKNWRNKERLPEKLWDMIYPLPNLETLNVPYNTYLYGFFSGIITYPSPTDIVKLPLSFCNGNHSASYCPIKVVSHQIGGLQWMMTKIKLAKDRLVAEHVEVSLRDLAKYLLTLYNLHLAMYGKMDDKLFELGLFTLWWLIHESGYYEDRKQDKENAIIRLNLEIEGVMHKNSGKIQNILSKRGISSNDVRSVVSTEIRKRFKERRDAIEREYNNIGRHRLFFGAVDFLQRWDDEFDVALSIDEFLEPSQYFSVVKDVFEREYPRGPVVTEIANGRYSYDMMREKLSVYEREYIKGKTETLKMQDPHVVKDASLIFLFVGMSVLRWDVVNAMLDEDHGKW